MDFCGPFHACWLNSPLLKTEFYYERRQFHLNPLHVDAYRCHYQPGEVTLVSNIG